MSSKIDVKKVIKKRDRNGHMMRLSYVLGFPLLILLVFIGSVSFMNGAAFTSTKIFGVSAAYLGVLVCLVAWVVVVIVQIIAAVITKSSAARGVTVVIVTLIVMIGGSVFFDIWAEKKVNSVRDDYVRALYGISEETEIEYVKNHSNKDILTYADENEIKAKYAKKYDKPAFKNVTFSDITFYKDMYGVYYADFTVSYKENSKDKVDAYNVPVSQEIDFNTYSYQVNHYVTWTSKGSLTDSYNAMIDDFCRVYNIGFASGVKGSVNTDGSEYGATKQVDKDGNPEYWFGEKGNVYKENGLYADGYIFGVDVATNILICILETEKAYAAEGKDLDAALEKAYDDARKSDAWRAYVKTDEYKQAYGSGGTADSYMLTEARLGRVVKQIAYGLGETGLADTLAFILPKVLDNVNISANDLKSLTLDKVVELVRGFGLDVTLDDLMALLGGFSNYEVSNVKPLMYFIENETMRNYAYAKYFAETHGANIGSVLVGDKIGKITMNDSGLSAEENAYSLEQCYKLRAYNSYVPMLYPLFAARRYTYIFAGIIACMMALFYYAQMKISLINKKLEKMCSLGGGR